MIPFMNVAFYDSIYESGLPNSMGENNAHAVYNEYWHMTKPLADYEDFENFKVEFLTGGWPYVSDSLHLAPGITSLPFATVLM